MNVRPPRSSFSARCPVNATISPRAGQGRNKHDMRKNRSSLVSDQSSRRIARSEEHTSELQSLMRISYAVFCLIQQIQHIDQPLNHHEPFDEHHLYRLTILP